DRSSGPGGHPGRNLPRRLLLDGRLPQRLGGPFGPFALGDLLAELPPELLLLLGVRLGPAATLLVLLRRHGADRRAVIRRLDRRHVVGHLIRRDLVLRHPFPFRRIRVGARSGTFGAAVVVVHGSPSHRATSAGLVLGDRCERRRPLSTR